MKNTFIYICQVFFVYRGAWQSMNVYLMVLNFETNYQCF